LLREAIFYFLYPKLYLFDLRQVTYIGRLIPVFPLRVRSWLRSMTVDTSAGFPLLFKFRDGFREGLMMIGKIGESNTIYPLLITDTEIAGVGDMVEKIISLSEKHMETVKVREEILNRETETLLSVLQELFGSGLRAMVEEADSFIKSIISLIHGKTNKEGEISDDEEQDSSEGGA